MTTLPDAAPSPDPSVLVVCVVFNPGNELRDFGRSLATASLRPIDLVLVNNGGPSPVAEEVAASLGGRVLASGGNLGYGGGANRGLATSESEWAVVANPDLVWEPGALDVLLEAGEAESRTGSLGPALLNTDGTVYPSARAVPSLRQGVGHAVFGRVWPANPWSRDYRREHEVAGDQSRPAGWLSGACLVLRRSALEDVGGFDESYFMFFEDLDLGERLRDAGWINLYVPTARVTHVQGVSWKSKPELMIRAHHASAKLYLHRRYSRWYQAPLRAAISIGLWAREVVEVRGAGR